MKLNNDEESINDLLARIASALEKICQNNPQAEMVRTMMIQEFSSLKHLNGENK